MDSMYAQHHDGVVIAGPEEVPAATVAVENVVSPAAPTPALVLAPATLVAVNWHSLVRADRGIILWHGDSDCPALRYSCDSFDAIFSVHGGTGASFRHAKFIVRYEGTEGQAPMTRLVFIVELSERAYEWARDFIELAMVRSGQQIHDALSNFCSTVYNNCIPSPLNCHHPTGQWTSMITGCTMNENFLDEYPPWTELPLDCWRLIHDRLDAFSTLSFPLVCKNWALVSTEKRRLQSGAPTLLTSPSLDGEGWDDPEECHRGIFFVQNIIMSRGTYFYESKGFRYSPTIGGKDALSRETFSVEVDDLRYSHWIGGKDQWLVTIDNGEGSFRLLNPITRVCTHLPPEYVRVWYHVKRIQLCQTPDEANGYFAIAIAPDQLAYTMDGSDQWFLMENPSERYCTMMYADAVLHKGKIVAICSNGDLWSWDLDEQGGNPKLLFRTTIYSEGSEVCDFILAPYLNNEKLLIVSPYGEHLSLREAGNRETFRNQWNFCVCGVAFCEVDIDAERMEDVHGIGDRALFLGPNYPFYVPVLKPSGDHLKRNHVYITDITDYDVISIDLGDDNLTRKLSFINYNGPSNHPYQVPMWFRPTLPRKAGMKTS